MKSQPKPPVSSLEAHLGFWLRFVSNHVSTRFQKILEEQGCSVTEWVALRTLFDKTETSNAEFIQALGITKGAASKVATRLEEKGFAKRKLADGSAREQVLLLTKQGMALVPQLAALADANDVHFFGHLKEAELLALKCAFLGLVAHHRLQEVPTE